MMEGLKGDYRIVIQKEIIININKLYREIKKINNLEMVPEKA